MLVVSWFICGFLYFFLYSYLFCKLLNISFKANEKIIICSVIISLVYIVYNKYMINDFLWLRPIIVNACSLVLLQFLYKKTFIETLISLLCIFIVMCVSELIFSFVMAFFLKFFIPIGPEFISKWYGYLFSNVLIIIVMILFTKISFVKMFFTNIIKWHNKNERKATMMYVTFSMIIFVFFLYNNFINVLPNQLLLITNVFCVAVVFFVISYFKEKANNNRIVTEYDHLLKYVNKYERLIEDKSKRQHEYKNQLVLIKGMISKTNKKAIEYIDSLYEEEKDDSNLEMLKKLQYLPSGGLKGLIYYKLEDMKDKKINVFVDISPKVKNVKVNKKLDSNLKDISKIIGVYLDNAIEAAVKSKEKYIVLEIYLEKDEWVFSLSNTYKGEINLNRIDNEGYTTKGSGKGYGLSLVKDIISHNSDLRQERELRGIYYTQKLYMKK